MSGFMYRLFETADRPQLLDRQVDELVFRIGPWGIAGIVLSIILWAAVVTLLVLLIVYFIKQIRHYPLAPVSRPAGTSSGGRVGAAVPPEPGVSSPPSAEVLRLLDERYARGEMGHDEYLTRRTNLLSGRAPASTVPGPQPAPAAASIPISTTAEALPSAPSTENAGSPQSQARADETPPASV